MKAPLNITKTSDAIQFDEIDRAYRFLRADVEQNEKNKADSVPIAGSYTKGEFVWNTNPTIDGNNMVLLGWSRMTTGSGHVLNTDWAECRFSTVSPAT